MNRKHWITSREIVKAIRGQQERAARPRHVNIAAICGAFWDVILGAPKK